MSLPSWVVTLGVAVGLSACASGPPPGMGTSGMAGGAGGAGTSGAAGAAGALGGGGTPGASGSAGATAGASGAGGTSSTGAGGAGGTSAGAAGSSSSGAADAGEAVGTGGSAGTGGASGAAGTTSGAGMDTPAPRAINTDHAGFREKTFTAQSLDSMATQGHSGSTEYAAVDTSKPLMKELCIVLTDMGAAPGIATADWMYPHGFHVLQIAYQNDLAMGPVGDTNASTPGDTRMDQFDGKGRVSWVTIKRADSLEGRVVKALQHMVTADPGGDWGWYLNADNSSVRWSDGCIVGFGYGGTMAAVIAHNVRLARAVSLSSPQAEGRSDAAWLKGPGATPAERVFAIFGQNDDPASPGRYEATTAALGYLGAVAHVGLSAQPASTNPFGGSHRLELDGSGKGSYCNAGADYPPCLYSFGLPMP
jgi:hypothetical protein